MFSLEDDALQYDRDPTNEIGIAQPILAIKSVCDKEECCQERLNACPLILSCDTLVAGSGRAYGSYCSR